MALDDRALGSTVSDVHSYVTLGVAFVRPDPNWSVVGMVHLRDANDNAVDVDVRRLTLQVHNGTITVPLSRKGPGFYQFAIAGEADSGGKSLRLAVLIDDKVVLKDERNIAVDAPNVRRLAVAGRGCAVLAQPGRVGATGLEALLVGLLLFMARMRARAIRRE